MSFPARGEFYFDFHGHSPGFFRWRITIARFAVKKTAGLRVTLQCGMSAGEPAALTTAYRGKSWLL